MTGPAPRPKVIHVTTTDISLAKLLGPQLEAFRDAGYDVVTASAPGPYLGEIEARGLRHVPLLHATRSTAPAEDARALRELYHLFRAERPDIVHTHNPKPGVYGRLAARAARVPVVVNTVHGLYAQPGDRLRRRLPVYALERLAATCSHAELVQNEEDVATLRSLRVPERKLVLLGNGIDLTRFDPAAVDPAAVARCRAELAGDAEVICGVVGRLVWEKGLREVLDAAKRLRTRVPGLRIVLVGAPDDAKTDGLSADELPAIAADTGAIFAGERHDMECVYRAFDFGVLASYREGFPRAAMEASAMGRATVATDIRGCRQVVDDGVTGTLVPVRDATALTAAIERYATDADLRQRAGAAARERALERFDQRRCIEITLATYERCLRAARRGSEPPARSS